MQNNRRDADTGKRWAHKHIEGWYRLGPWGHVLTYHTKSEAYDCLLEDVGIESVDYYSVELYNETK